MITVSDFKLGDIFKSIGTGKWWRVTDIGKRVIVAVCLNDHADDLSWYNGPTYAVQEFVWDEDDMQAIEFVKL